MTTKTKMATMSEVASYTLLKGTDAGDIKSVTNATDGSSKPVAVSVAEFCLLPCLGPPRVCRPTSHRRIETKTAREQTSILLRTIESLLGLKSERLR